MTTKKTTLFVAVALAAFVTLAMVPRSARAQSIIGGLSSSIVGTTVPENGDVNPYGVAIVPTTVGKLKAGHILVSNFNEAGNQGAGFQGTGTTIVDIDPNNATMTPGKAPTFAQIKLSSGMQCPGGVGLTTALAVLKSGWVIVGSLPTATSSPNIGTIFAANAGCLIVLNAEGEPVETFSGGNINGPWDMTVLDQGSSVTLFVSNVLNGVLSTLPPNNGTPVFPLVNQGTVVRMTLAVPPQGFGVPVLLTSTIVGSGFSEQANSAALIIGPTGLGLSGGTLYVADTLANRIASIPNALTRSTTAFAGQDVSSGGFLNGPLGLAIAPNGDILTVNSNDSNMVETTPAGTQVATNGTSGDGAGSLFGLAVQASQNSTKVYFVDDSNNTLNVLK